jgi:hypothetical protein
MGPNTNNANRPLTVANEPIFVLLSLRNPLHIPVQLANVNPTA